MKLSLSMIVRNADEGKYSKCLESIVPYVDEVCIADTGSTNDCQDVAVQVCKGNGVKLVLEDYKDPSPHPEHGWISNFANARNFAQDLVTGDVWCWIDADTYLTQGDDWRTAIDRHFIEDGADAMQVRYDYEIDENDNVRRAVPNLMVLRSGLTRWAYPVHEVPQPISQKRMNTPSYVDDEDAFRTVHMHKGRVDKSHSDRNLWILEKWIAEGGDMNDRMWNMYGGALMDDEQHELSLDAFGKGLEMHGNPDEHYMMHLRAAQCWKALGDPEGAIRSCLSAIAVRPWMRTPFLVIAENMMDVNRPEEALTWCDLAEAVNGDAQAPSVDPTLTKLGPIYTRARAYGALQMAKEAADEWLKVYEHFPSSEEARENLQFNLDFLHNSKKYEALTTAVSMVEDKELGRKMLAAAPKELWTFPEVAIARKPKRPPDKKGVVAIYAPPSMGRDPWDPSSIGGGIGGSEEAVIYLSRELSAIGWHVEVYGFPTKDWINTLDPFGVAWIPHFVFEDEPFDAFISWRNWPAAKVATNAKSKWLWLHDVVSPSYVDPKSGEDYDGIFCLTDFHAGPVKDMGLGDKVCLTSNGLRKSAWKDGKNDPKEFIYASSPDRGLVELLTMWPQIREGVKDARLHIYYGFTKVWDAMAESNSTLRQMRKFIEERVETLKDEGVVWHGMVGHEELSQAFADCGFWLYPTSWPETSCITAMKAQANGCIPLTSGYKDSGVPETCRYDLGLTAREGMIAEDHEWLQAWEEEAIKVANRTDLDEYRQEMRDWARKEFSWQKVAEDWSRRFSETLEPKLVEA